MEKKKPKKSTCPFCGSSNIGMLSGKYKKMTYAYVVCWFCKARGPVRTTPEAADKEWDEVSQIVKEYYDGDNEDD